MLTFSSTVKFIKNIYNKTRLAHLKPAPRYTVHLLPHVGTLVQQPTRCGRRQTQIRPLLIMSPSVTSVDGFTALTRTKSNPRSAVKNPSLCGGAHPISQLTSYLLLSSSPYIQPHTIAPRQEWQLHRLHHFKNTGIKSLAHG